MIPIARPAISEDDKAAVLQVLESGQLAHGEWVERFEEAFAAYVGVRYAIATSSGSTALEALLEAVGIGPGDEVVVPPFTFVATSNAVLQRGARPLFVDIEPDTFNLDPDRLEDALRARPNVKAVLVVHLYGLPARMDAITEVTARHGVLLLEDAAQAHGAAFRGRRVGSFGQAGIFSFYPTKNITTGEGGMIVTSDPQIASRARLLVHVGTDGTTYRYEVIGHNYRMTNIAAALGCSQLRRLDAVNAVRRRNALRLNAALKGLPGIMPPAEPEGAFHVYNQYTIRSRRRDALQAYLTERGIGTKVYYPEPLPHTPAYRGLDIAEGPWPQTERACREVLSLPVHPGLTDEDLETVAEAVRAFAIERAGAPA
ncbi:MAG: DegT/DnrJ/EryC1/StrS family aminotransferase [Armatimonadota bacterium]|nr:DegT/DnrJ/EryC1/StrS family aminotransferase [Armatimonadota bacterium]